MKATSIVFSVLLLGGVTPARADPQQTLSAMQWLNKITTASRQLNYAGTFVYHHDNRVETSRIWHFNDAGSEQEKLEVLDGPPREIVRSGEHVTCYLPEHKAVVIEKRKAGRFPALLPEQLPGITDNYAAGIDGQDRVAGNPCQIIVLMPKDNLRYQRQFCADLLTGLLLRARTYNDKNELIESFAFTQITIGSGVKKDMLKSRFAAASGGWRVDRSALQQSVASGESGWMLKNQLAGFKRVAEIQRPITGRKVPVSQIVYSDGLAAISVFIEPMPASPPQPGPTYQGAVNIYVQPHGDHVLTVVGEAPAATVKLIAESMTPKR